MAPDCNRLINRLLGHRMELLVVQSLKMFYFCRGRDVDNVQILLSFQAVKYIGGQFTMMSQMLGTQAW